MSEFSLDSFLEIEFEDYFSSFLLPNSRNGQGAAKKRYAGLKLNGELYFTGMESKRSDWSPLAKDFQNQLYLKVMKSEPYKGWIRSYVHALKNGAYNDLLIFSKRIRKPVSHYKNIIPPHIQAAKKLKNQHRKINYIITKKSPTPVELNPKNIDFNYYIYKQLAPVADSILFFKNLSFKQLINTQLDLFINSKSN